MGIRVQLVHLLLLTATLVTATSFAMPPAHTLSRLPSVEVTELQLSDPSDAEKITYFDLGQQVVLRTSIHNGRDTVQPFVILTEIRDSAGVTVYLSWQSGTMIAYGNYTMESSWTPDTVCWIENPGCNQYELRGFVIDGFENPQVLSEVRTSGGVTLLETTSEGMRFYRLVQEGEEYKIEYSLDSGFISNVVVDRELTTMTLQLEQVTNNTDLTLKVQKSLLALLAGCGGEPVPIESLVDPIVFLDSIPIFITVVDWGVQSATLKLSMEAGSEEVELVAGGC